MREQLKIIMETNPFKSLNDAVYELLFQGIIHLTITPGSVLSETSLAKQFDVSRTPIRNALMMLQKDGLVTQNKGHSFFVLSFDREECQHLMEARLAVEGQAAYLAAERMDEQDLLMLEATREKTAEATRTWNIEGMIQFDHQFHRIIVKGSKNRFFIDMYNKLLPRILHYRHFVFYQVSDEVLAAAVRIQNRQHETIAQAIQSGFGYEARDRVMRDISDMGRLIDNWRLND